MCKRSKYLQLTDPSKPQVLCRKVVGLAASPKSPFSTLQQSHISQNATSSCPGYPSHPQMKVALGPWHLPLYAFCLPASPNVSPPQSLRLTPLNFSNSISSLLRILFLYSASQSLSSLQLQLCEVFRFLQHRASPFRSPSIGTTHLLTTCSSAFHPTPMLLPVALAPPK